MEWVVITLIGLAVIPAMYVRSKARAAKRRALDAEVSQGLRMQMLELPADEFGTASADDQAVAIIMDLAHPNGCATVVAAQTGDASIYFSSSGTGAIHSGLFFIGART